MTTTPEGAPVDEPTITAITLPTPERAVIGTLFAAAGLDPEQWQRDALAAKVEELQMQQAQAQVQGDLAAAQQQIREQLPTLFPDAAPEQ